MDDRGREDHAKNGDDCCHEGKSPEETVREVPDLFLGAFPHVTSKNRDEGSSHGAFGDQAAEKVGYAVGQDVGVSGKRGAEEEGNALVADVAKDAADDSDQGDDRGRLEDMLFIGQRAVLRGPNPNENNDLTGKTRLT